MNSRLSFLMMLAMLGVVVGGSLQAQDKRVPRSAAAAPGLPDTYSQDRVTTGLAAGAATKVVVGRGGWCLSFVVTGAEETHAAFEYVEKGFCPINKRPNLKYLGSQGSGINRFHYYDVDGWQIIMAIRNQAIGGTHDMYFFVNGGTEPMFYAKGKAYDPA